MSPIYTPGNLIGLADEIKGQENRLHMWEGLPKDLKKFGLAWAKDLDRLEKNCRQEMIINDGLRSSEASLQVRLGSIQDELSSMAKVLKHSLEDKNDIDHGYCADAVIVEQVAKHLERMALSAGKWGQP